MKLFAVVTAVVTGTTLLLLYNTFFSRPASYDKPKDDDKPKRVSFAGGSDRPVKKTAQMKKSEKKQAAAEKKALAAAAEKHAADATCPEPTSKPPAVVTPQQSTAPPVADIKTKVAAAPQGNNKKTADAGSEKSPQQPSSQEKAKIAPALKQQWSTSKKAVAYSDKTAYSSFDKSSKLPKSPHWSKNGGGAYDAFKSNSSNSPRSPQKSDGDWRSPTHAGSQHQKGSSNSPSNGSNGGANGWPDKSAGNWRTQQQFSSVSLRKGAQSPAGGNGQVSAGSSPRKGHQTVSGAAESPRNGNNNKKGPLSPDSTGSGPWYDRTLSQDWRNAGRPINSYGLPSTPGTSQCGNSQSQAFSRSSSGLSPNSPAFVPSKASSAAVTPRAPPTTSHSSKTPSAQAAPFVPSQKADPFVPSPNAAPYVPSAKAGILNAAPYVPPVKAGGPNNNKSSSSALLPTPRTPSNVSSPRRLYSAVTASKPEGAPTDSPQPAPARANTQPADASWLEYITPPGTPRSKSQKAMTWQVRKSADNSNSTPKAPTYLPVLHTSRLAKKALALLSLTESKSDLGPLNVFPIDDSLDASDTKSPTCTDIEDEADAEKRRKNQAKRQKKKEKARMMKHNGADIDAGAEGQVESAPLLAASG